MDLIKIILIVNNCRLYVFQTGSVRFTEVESSSIGYRLLTVMDDSYQVNVKIKNDLPKISVSNEINGMRNNIIYLDVKGEVA